MQLSSWGGANASADYNGLKVVKQVRQQASQLYEGDKKFIAVGEDGKAWCIDGDGNLSSTSLSEWSKSTQYCYIKFTYDTDYEGYHVQLVNINGDAPDNSYLYWSEEDEELKLVSKSQIDDEFEEMGEDYALWRICYEEATARYFIASYYSYSAPKFYITLHEQHNIYNPSGAYGTTGWEFENGSDNITAPVEGSFKAKGTVSSMKQVFKDMPAGTYTISLWAKAVGYNYSDIDAPRPHLVVNEMSVAFEQENEWTYYENTFAEVDEEGNYTVNISFYDDEDDETYVLFKDVTLTCQLHEDRTTPMGRYGTICLPYEFESNGAELYTIGGIENIGGVDYLVLVSYGTDGTEGVPYIYQATDNSQRFYEEENGQTIAVPSSGAYGLMGSFYRASEGLLQVPQGGYVLQTQGDRQAFYQVTSDDIYCGSYKCYILPDSYAARAFLAFPKDKVSAITAIDALVSGKAEIYNLNGQKLQKLQKGANIVNGAKVYVK